MGGATALSAIAYQVEHKVSLERRDHSFDRPEAERTAYGVETPVEAGAPIGRLGSARLGLSVVVAEGDDDNTLLEVAVGHLPDTPLPWQEETPPWQDTVTRFPRRFRSVQPGDEIRFATRHGTFRYRVTRHTVVEPDELWVLDASPAAALTLITCYPFDYVGPAPRRFIVHAERMANVSDSPHTTATEGDTP